MGVSQYMKQAKSSFVQQNFEEAIRQLNFHLEDEPEDVRALTLKGASEQRLHDDEKSISTFQRALQIAPNDLTIWKGLISTYLQAKKYDEFFDATIHALVLISTSSNDDEHYNDALKLFERCREHIAKAGRDVSVSTQIKLLEMQLPLPDRPSPEYVPIYKMFEGHIFPNYNALSDLLQLSRKELSTSISKIKSRKKTSINFSAANASREIVNAITNSKLEMLLELKISTEDNDDTRREAEAELLNLLVQNLDNATPKAKSSSDLRSKIKSLAEGMAMFEPRTPLAFELTWDWDPPALVKEISDDKKPADSDNTNVTSPLGTYIQLFPAEPLAKVLEAYLSKTTTDQDRNNAFKQYNGESVYGWTITAQYFLDMRIYEFAIDSAHSGLKAIMLRRDLFGMPLSEAELKLKLVLGQAYTNFQTPKNFPVAQTYFEEVLSVDPDHLEARVGKGYVLSQLGEFKSAMAVLEGVVSVYPDNALALGELSWCQIQSGDTKRGIEGLKRCLSLPPGPYGKADIKWRIGYTLWTLEKFDESFEWFVSTLQESPAYAPAYTYLGLFYNDIVRDSQRAKRCFYKALEIDNGQALAGERLAADFAHNKQWDLVETVATTVLSSGKFNNTTAIDWPYRAMGIVCINSNRHAEAVKFFQRCLKTQWHDVQAWIGLGEAYIYSGRYRSAEKALLRALKLDPKNFSALYILSLAQRAVLDFPASAASLHKALEFTPKSSAALLWALADNSLRAAEYFASQSMLGEAFNETHEALKAIERALGTEGISLDSSVMWGSAAQAFMLLHHIGRISVDDVRELKPVLDSLSKLGSYGSEYNTLAELSCLAAEKYVELAASEIKPRRATSRFCAALANSLAQRTEVAIEHFKAAITLEPRNDRLWTAYGVCLQRIDPLVAQHCYVRSLTLNGRSQDTWVKLAGLYIMLDDTELAAEALDRAQALDPDNCRAWVGQALVESLQGSKSAEHLQRLLKYAYSLSHNDRLASFAMALKDYEIGFKSKSVTLGALEKLLAVDPTNRDAKLLMGLILEQKGDYESALTRLEPLEEWCHVARVHLALGQYEAAIAAANKDSTDTDTAILSCLLTTGLAYYFLHDLDAAIEAFTLALEHDNTEDVLRLLVEMLYATGTDDARQVALDQLFESIGSKGSTLQVTLLLGVLGLLNNDKPVIEAAQVELKAQITAQVSGEDLAQACHVLSLLEDSNSSFQRALFQWPTDYALWRRVDKQQALLVAEGNTTNATELSQAHTEAGGITNCQRGVFYEPTSNAAWRGLAASFVD